MPKHVLIRIVEKRIRWTNICYSYLSCSLSPSSSPSNPFSHGQCSTTSPLFINLDFEHCGIFLRNRLRRLDLCRFGNIGSFTEHTTATGINSRVLPRTRTTIMIGSGEDAAADTLGVLKSMDRASQRENLEFRGRAGQEKPELLNVHESPDQFIGVEKGKYWFPWSLFVSPSSYGKKGTRVEDEAEGAHSIPRRAEHRKF
jgi:hypothetical protein